jgi:hypothetical protein
MEASDGVGGGAEARGGADLRGTGKPGAVRAADLEPYVGLLYVARLFRMAALVVVFALAGEVIAGVVLEGAGALFPLFREIIQAVVLSAILWGAGDVALLMIDVGHDVRGFRILLGRISYRATRAAMPEASEAAAPPAGDPLRRRDRTP